MTDATQADPNPWPTGLRFGATSKRKTMVRDGAVEVWTPHGVRGLEQLLLDALPADRKGRWLVGLGGEPVVAAVLRRTDPQAEVVEFQLDRFVARRCEEALRDNGVEGVTVRTISDLTDLDGPFDGIALPIAASFERQLARSLIEQARRILRKKGELYVAADGPGVDVFLRKVLKKAFGVQGTKLFERRRKGCVWKVINRKPTDTPARDHRRLTELECHGARLSFQTRPGVFGYGRVDRGTLALLECARFREDDRTVDLGCGAGVLGLFAAKLAPKGSALLVDSSARAARLSAENQALNGLTNVTVLEPRADLEDLPEPEGGFTLALANPPYFSNMRIATSFVSRAAELLGADGRLLLVARNRERHEPILQEHFPRVACVERRGYAVFLASRRTDLPEFEDFGHETTGKDRDPSDDPSDDGSQTGSPESRPEPGREDDSANG